MTDDAWRPYEPSRDDERRALAYRLRMASAECPNLNCTTNGTCQHQANCASGRRDLIR